MTSKDVIVRKLFTAALYAQSPHRSTVNRREQAISLKTPWPKAF
jgi:hypothetical protein